MLPYVLHVSVRWDEVPIVSLVPICQTNVTTAVTDTDVAISLIKRIHDCLQLKNMTSRNCAAAISFSSPKSYENNVFQIRSSSHKIFCHISIHLIPNWWETYPGFMEIKIEILLLSKRCPGFARCCWFNSFPAQLAWLQVQKGSDFNLPTESEWTYYNRRTISVLTSNFCRTLSAVCPPTHRTTQTRT